MNTILDDTIDTVYLLQQNKYRCFVGDIELLVISMRFV